LIYSQESLILDGVSLSVKFPPTKVLNPQNGEELLYLLSSASNVPAIILPENRAHWDVVYKSERILMTVMCAASGSGKVRNTKVQDDFWKSAPWSLYLQDNGNSKVYIVHLSIHWRTFSNAVFLFKSTTITGYNESSGAEFMFGKGMLILLFSSMKRSILLTSLTIRMLSLCPRTMTTDQPNI